MPSNTLHQTGATGGGGSHPTPGHAAAMNNLYAKWCAENGRKPLEPYAFKCTASVSGSDYLADLRGAARSHFVATTVDLLSTGVDVPVVRNVVFPPRP